VAALNAVTAAAFSEDHDTGRNNNDDEDEDKNTMVIVVRTSFHSYAFLFAINDVPAPLSTLK